MSLFFHLPINLYPILHESAEELFSGQMVYNHTDFFWTVTDTNEKVLGWFQFTEIDSNYEVEVSWSLSEYKQIVEDVMNRLLDFMHEMLESDQCKTGKCSASC